MLEWYFDENFAQATQSCSIILPANLLILPAGPWGPWGPWGRARGPDPGRSAHQFRCPGPGPGPSRPAGRIIKSGGRIIAHLRVHPESRNFTIET